MGPLTSDEMEEAEIYLMKQLQLSSFYTEIRAMKNGDDICNKNDLEVLTPAHFLIGRPITAIVEPSLLQCESNRLNVWQRITKSVQTIWKRWGLSYLNSCNNERNGLLIKKMSNWEIWVLISEENLPPCKWLLGRVVKIYMGKDKKVRVVDVKTSKEDRVRCGEWGNTEKEDHRLRRTAVLHHTASAAEIRAVVGTTVTQRTVRNRLLLGQLL
ncbi:DUF5641 domain-containing protein [Trichonephila clavipes]|nr:DUF5641 domain-containing protein [Trichonephila clavipes]